MKTLAASPLILVAFLSAAGCGRVGENAAHEVLHAIDQGKITGTKGNMETLARAIEASALDRGGYPQGSSIDQAISVLVPTYLRGAVTMDAWGNTFLYQSDGRSFTLTSPGADGSAGSADDVVMTDSHFTHLPTPGGG